MAKIVSNKRQLNRLVELMEKNLDVAKGFCSKTSAQPKWEQFATELNSLGPPERDWHKWQRVWIDLKCKIKKKRKVVNKVEITATGGGPTRCHQFNDMEGAVIRMLELNTCVDPPGIEFGLNETDTALPATSSQLSLPNDGTQSPERPTAQTKTESTPGVEELQQRRITLLENETSAQKQFYDNMTNLMSDIKKSVQNIEYYSKKKYQQDKEHNSEILKLKTEKLKLYKQNKENKDNHRKAKLKLKIETLELLHLLK